MDTNPEKVSINIDLYLNGREIMAKIFKKKGISSIKNILKFNLKRLLDCPILNVDELILGDKVIIEPDVIINCKRLVLGDGVVIKSGTRISMVDLVIGDYSKIHDNCLLTGTDWCRIGHNCWVGHNSIIDSIGTTTIGDNVGIGAHSQLWSHIYFGDLLEGCRFGSQKPLVIEDDVWFVGHCIVSPIVAKNKSMALVGSVVTKDLENNHVYAGVPARDITDHMGIQYQTTELNIKREMMEKHLQEFIYKFKPKQNRIRIVDKIDLNQLNLSQFSLTERLYVKNMYPEEVSFIRFLHPSKAKFLPIRERDWVNRFLFDIN